MASGVAHVLDIHPLLINEQGEILLEIGNPLVNNRPQPTITFNPNDGIELLYVVGSFEGNLTRALMILWIRLSFLTMLALAAGAYLSFPVACVLALMIYMAAASSGFILESMEHYTIWMGEDLTLWERLLWIPMTTIQLIQQGDVGELFRLLLVLIGRTFMLIVPPFSDYDPTMLLANGRLISMRMLTSALFWVGIIATGAVALIGGLLFRNRELAQVTV